MEIKPIDNCDYKDDEVYIDESSITYVQNGDCSSADVQSITLSTDNNGSSRYIWFKTDRWAISDIDDLIKILKDFQVRVGMGT